MYLTCIGHHICFLLNLCFIFHIHKCWWCAEWEKKKVENTYRECLEEGWKEVGRRSNGNSKFSTFLKAALDKGHRDSKLICRKHFNKAISANTSRVVFILIYNFSSLQSFWSIQSQSKLKPNVIVQTVLFVLHIKISFKAKSKGIPRQIPPKHKKLNVKRMIQMQVNFS